MRGVGGSHCEQAKGLLGENTCSKMGSLHRQQTVDVVRVSAWQWFVRNPTLLYSFINIGYY